jgi:hypothetical protein
MANLIRFWVGAGDTKVSLTPFDASQLQGQPLFFEVPAQPMSLPVRTGKTVTLQKMTLREWVVSLLKDAQGVKTHQSYVDIDSAVIEQKFRKSDSRPYRSLDFTNKDMVEALVDFVQQVWANTTVKVARGEATAAKANDALSGITFK